METEETLTEMAENSPEMETKITEISRATEIPAAVPVLLPDLDRTIRRLSGNIPDTENETGNRKTEFSKSFNC